MNSFAIVRPEIQIDKIMIDGKKIDKKDFIFVVWSNERRNKSTKIIVHIYYTHKLEIQRKGLDSCWAPHYTHIHTHTIHLCKRLDGGRMLRVLRSAYTNNTLGKAKTSRPRKKRKMFQSTYIVHYMQSVMIDNFVKLDAAALLLS